MNDDAEIRAAMRGAVFGELARGVAHDTNNVLASVLGQAELGLLSKDPGRMKVALESILSSARELKALSERLASFGKHLDPTPCRANLLEAFRDLYTLLERPFVKTGVRIEHRYDPNLPSVWCAPGEASVVLLFCVRLALDAARRSAQSGMSDSVTASRPGLPVPTKENLVKLEAYQEDGCVAFRVSLDFRDTPAVESVLQLDHGPLSAERASKIAEEQGGSLRIERDGTGAHVTVRFPATRERGGAAKERSAPSPAESISALDPSARRVRVLIVDDEEPIRELLREAFEARACRVETAPDGETALDGFRRGTIDLVFTDVMLPGMDGLALLRKLRALDPGPVMVVLTGGPREESMGEAAASGAAVVLSKPFEIPDLLSIVESVRMDPSGMSLRAFTPCANQPVG